jgi:hypothetical protein
VLDRGPLFGPSFALLDLGDAIDCLQAKPSYDDGRADDRRAQRGPVRDVRRTPCVAAVTEQPNGGL